MPAIAPSTGRRATWLSWLLLALGAAGFAALWIMLGLFNGRANGWMAVLAALDMALLLRLGHWPGGASRALAAVVATTLVVVVANWVVIAGQLGRMLGLGPWESSVRLGADHAWTLARLLNSGADEAWIAVALVVALVTAR